VSAKVHSASPSATKGSAAIRDKALAVSGSLFLFGKVSERRRLAAMLAPR
jgi:hypothetical protein